MKMKMKEVSELEYLRKLKESNGKALQGYIRMIQDRDHVIRTKDTTLQDIRNYLMDLMQKPGVDHVLNFQMVQMIDFGLKAGLTFDPRKRKEDGNVTEPEDNDSGTEGD